MLGHLLCEVTGNRQTGFVLAFKFGRIPVELDIGEEAIALIGTSPSKPLVSETKNADKEGFHLRFSDVDGMPRVMDIWVNQDVLHVWPGPASGDPNYDPDTGYDTGW